MLETVTCERCGSREADELFTGSDRLLGVPGRFRVVQCPQCRLVYTNPRPSGETLRDYYPPGYGIYAPEGGQAVRMACYHRRIARQLNRDVRGAARRVLDVGCGDGAFLSEMRDLGWETVGLEMDEGAAARAREQRGLEVITGTVENATFPADRFDLVTLSHVLEHVPHPRSTLRQIKGWLPDNGRLFLTLPNVQSWERRVFGVDWYPWDLPRHLFHFSPETLGGLLQEDGFVVQRCRFLSGFYLPQSLRYRRRGPVPPAAIPPHGRPNPYREALKTPAFMALLQFASITGLVVRGEIMELVARKGV